VTAFFPHWPRLAALAAALALAGCGVKGPLEPPPQATAATTQPTAQVTERTTTPEPVAPMMRRPRRPPPIARPDQPFVLDPLL
jgi:predicted small lipoprotein YifL